MNNCLLTVDFEDFSFDLQRSLKVDNPIGRPNALRKSIRALEEIIKKTNSKNQVTFFVTGQCARDYPEIIREIAESGHEIACHGYFHDNIYNMTPSQFGDSLDQAIEYLQLASQKKILGFRAPSFSINNKEWALEEIAKRFTYDSSYLTDDNLGNNSIMEFFYGKHKLKEIPIYTPKFIFNKNIRVIGGTFLKLLPINKIISFINESIKKNYIPIIYIHPYELLYDNEFWVNMNEMNDVPKLTKYYWAIRQNQWLSIGNRGFVKKLQTILEVYSHQGSISNYLNLIDI